MKVTKVILALMAVAMMVIVPLSVADVDAGKTPATDAEKGFYVVNKEAITDTGKVTAAMDVNELLSLFKKSTKYLNQDILDISILGYGTGKLVITSISITTYEDDEYDSLSGLTDEAGVSKIIAGSFKYALVTTAAGKFFKESADATDGDFLKEANKTFGDVSKDAVINVELELTVKTVEKKETEYDEAKNTYVMKTVVDDEIFYIDCKAKYSLYGTDKDAVNAEYDYKEIKNITSTYDCTVSKEEDAPATASYTQSATDEIYDCVLKGKIGDKEYSNSSIEKELKDEAKKYVDGKTQKDPTTVSTYTEDDISPIDCTLAESKIATLDLAGYTGVNDVSKAKSNFNSIYDDLRIKSSDSGTPVWVWIIVAVVVILIVVGLVVWLKKSGKI